MKTHLYLIRHGATIFTAQNRFTGSSDPPLSEEGRRDAERVARRLSALRARILE